MSLPNSFTPSSGYLPSSTGSVNQAVVPLAAVADREHRGARRLDVLGLVARRLGDLRGQHVADLGPLGVLGAGAQHLHRLGVRPHGVVRRGQVLGRGQLVAGRVRPVEETEADEALGLVLRRPDLDPVRELVGQEAGVLGEPVGRIAVQPAALLVERLRVVPVEDRDERLDPVRAELVDEAAVEVEPLGVGGADPVRQHARPGDAEAIGLGAQRLDERDVLLEAVVVVAGDVAGVAVEDRALSLTKDVPHRRPLAVLGRGPLDLIAGRRHAPGEVLGERPAGRPWPRPSCSPRAPRSPAPRHRP